jgi:hypothetical protein
VFEKSANLVDSLDVSRVKLEFRKIGLEFKGFRDGRPEVKLLIRRVRLQSGRLAWRSGELGSVEARRTRP